jgi:2-dehydropantoate 2-reductase
MKIAIMGCGAMGSVYAGLLASAGNEVLAIDRWAEHVEAIRSRGLRVEGASGDRTVRVAASRTAPDTLVDLVVIATKASAARAAAR